MFDVSPHSPALIRTWIQFRTPSLIRDMTLMCWGCRAHPQVQLALLPFPTLMVEPLLDAARALRHGLADRRLQLP